MTPSVSELGTARDVLLLDGSQTFPADLVGGKAAGIARMAAAGLPVPPAFVLVTDVCSRYLTLGSTVLDALDADVDAGLDYLERATGRRFGADPSPLLVSVRGGAATSMPGMLDTLLNVGMHARSPRRQLRVAIEAVLQSWLAPAASAYRWKFRLDNRAGTAVIVQAMVYGNADTRSGTGVLITRNPVTGAAEPLGEWLDCAQGDELMSGTTNPSPLSTLAQAMPEVYRELIGYAQRLAQDSRDALELEFTVQSGRLWLLQTRLASGSPRTSANTVGGALAADWEDARVLARGSPACPGVATGIVVDDPARAYAMAAQGANVVLARPTTDPRDLPGMMASAAVITEIGGVTSHAAVISRELGIPCVVGCGRGSVTGLVGRTVTVRGDTGEIRAGRLPTRSAVQPDGPDSITK